MKALITALFCNINATNINNLVTQLKHRTAIFSRHEFPTTTLIASMNNHTGYIFPVVIVPMGEDKGRIEDAVDSCYEIHSGLKITVSRPINYDPENFENAATKNLT